MARPGSDTDQLQLHEVATMLNITYESAKTMRSRGELLKESGMLGRTPWWYRWKVEQHVKERAAERSA